MADPATPTAGATDPASAIAKYSATTQAGADQDAAIITRVEGQLANSPMGWLQGLLGETSSKADSEKGEAQDKVDEMDEEVSKNAKDAPPDAGAPPTKGTAARPAVKTPASAKGAGDAAGKGKKGDAGGAKGKGPGKAGGTKPAAKGGAPGAGGDGGGAVAALAGGGGDISAALDAYEPKAPGTKDTIAKIKQMGDIAKGFSGQIDSYMGTATDGVNGALAKAGNWIGEGKNIAAVWENNPYKKADGFLGTIMKVLSSIKSIAGVVGSICGKIGLILTVVGLLGMIFPPIGAAVSAVARILNIVGLICDVISFALSGVLTGLNGVKLAQLAASGASPEEKAATADLMMSEANDCAGSVISLAMQFGPKFMKGMLGKSKGILNGLMKRAKAVLGNLAAKTVGNVKSFVTKVLGKFGVKGRVLEGAWQAEKGAMKKAGEFVKKQAVRAKDTVVNSGAYKKAAATGAKVWKAGGDVVDKIKATPAGKKVGQAAEFVKKKSTEFSTWTKGKVNQFNDSAFAKKLDTFAAKTNKFGDKIDLEMKVEKLGEKAGGIGTDWGATKKLATGTEALEKNTADHYKKLAAGETASVAEAREKYLRSQAGKKNDEYKDLKSDGADLKTRAEPWKEGKQLGREADQVGDLTKKEAALAAEAAEKKAKEDLAAAETKEAAEKAAKEARNTDPAKYAEDAQTARTKRRELEGSMGGDDAERKRILGLGENATEAEKTQLTALQTKLKPLDEARTADDLAYKTLSGGAEKQKAPEGAVETGKAGYDAFKKGRDAYDTWGHFGSDGPTDRGKNWDSAESFDFKDPLKWDKGGAKANAGSRADDKAKKMGGAPALTAPADTAAADFHAFVVKRQASSSIAASARGILARIKRKDPAADTAATDTKAPKAVTTAPGTTPTTNPNGPSNSKEQPSANASTTDAPASSTASSTPDTTAAPAADTTAAASSGGADTSGAEPAAAEPAAAGGGADAGAGGGEPIPYWPHLLAPDGEFTMAMKEFSFMRKVAIEFKKGQVSAKQKGVDTLAVYGQYEKYAEKRKQDAAAHKTETDAAGQTAQANQGAAGEGANESGKAGSEQDKGKGQAGQKAAVDLPEPESRGFWGRIIGRIKRWAKNKASEIFGWIQEKIADVIIRGLCGVSMGDMKAYSGALKNQQARAKGVADTGAATTDQAAAASEKTKTTSETETSKAEADIAQADTNLVEADTFLGDINNFEQQLKAEMIAAQAFIQQITAEVTAARAKDKEDKAKAAEEAKKRAADAANGSDSTTAATASTDSSSGVSSSTDTTADQANTSDETNSSQPGDVSASSSDQDPAVATTTEGQDEEKDEANDAIVKEAVAYVGGAGETAVGQLEGKKDDYKNQISAAVTNRDKGMTKEIEPLADEIVSHFKEVLGEMKGHLGEIEGSSDAAVEAVCSIAGDLDDAIATAHKALDDAFTGLYEKIKGSDKTKTAQVMDGINDVAKPYEDQAQSSMTAAEPVADRAWDHGKDVVGAVANPVGNWVEDRAVGAVDLTTRAAVGTGYGVGVGMEAYGEAASYGVPMMPM